MYVLGVHGRTREQKDNTSTRANWDAIKVSLWHRTSCSMCCSVPRPLLYVVFLGSIARTAVSPSRRCSNGYNRP